MTAFDVLAKALKATALVVLLSFAWTMSANAHAGHGAASKTIEPAAKTLPEDARQTLAVASLALEHAGVCDRVATGASAPTGYPQEDTPGRACCGTMCTVAFIEHGIPLLALRTAHRIRLDAPPETLSPARAPALHARPPRTIDIA